MNLASPEKSLIDCLFFDLAPLSIIMQAIKLAKDKNCLDKSKKICLGLKNKQFLKKAGIVFDSSGYDMHKYFKNYLDYNPLVMNKKLCGLLDKSKFRKWGLNAAKFFPIGRGISEGLSIIRRYRKGAVS